MTGRSILVPPRRLRLLRELTDGLQGLGIRWDVLHEASDPLLFDDLADGLDALFRTAADLAPQRGGTGCEKHPGGPVDPEPPTGWGACLLCNLRRRRGRLDRVPAPEPAPRSSGWTVPGAPYTFQALCAVMGHVRDAVFELHLLSEAPEFTEAADLIHQAFIIARELSRPRPGAGCGRHPGGPVELDGSCLLCRARNHLGDDPTVALRAPSTPRRILQRRHAYVDDTPHATTAEPEH